MRVIYIKITGRSLKVDKTKSGQPNLLHVIYFSKRVVNKHIFIKVDPRQKLNLLLKRPGEDSSASDWQASFMLLFKKLLEHKRVCCCYLQYFGNTYFIFAVIYKVSGMFYRFVCWAWSVRKSQSTSKESGAQAAQNLIYISNKTVC